MWELKTAADLTLHSIYVPEGGASYQARKVGTAPVPGGGAVAFAFTPLWAWDKDAPASSTTLATGAPLYILTCTCNGMAFIANRWAYTGECSCVHIPLPKES